jgi:hypothetical protein
VSIGRDFDLQVLSVMTASASKADEIARNESGSFVPEADPALFPKQRCLYR